MSITHYLNVCTIIIFIQVSGCFNLLGVYTCEASSIMIYFEADRGQ